MPEYYISLWDDKELIEYNFAEIDNLGYEQETRYDIDFPEEFIKNRGQDKGLKTIETEIDGNLQEINL